MIATPLALQKHYSIDERFRTPTRRGSDRAKIKLVFLGQPVAPGSEPSFPV
jgi:hypothetical protein